MFESLLGHILLLLKSETCRIPIPQWVGHQCANAQGTGSNPSMYPYFFYLTITILRIAFFLLQLKLTFSVDFLESRRKNFSKGKYVIQ